MFGRLRIPQDSLSPRAQALADFSATGAEHRLKASHEGIKRLIVPLRDAGSDIGADWLSLQEISEEIRIWNAPPVI